MSQPSSAPSSGTANSDFSSNYPTQVYPPGAGPSSAETRLRLYANEHSWRSDANAWVIDDFKGWD